MALLEVDNLSIAFGGVKAEQNVSFAVESGAYLRVAHIYMLISMPTDTSTIFGAFQAMWRSFRYRTNFALVG